MGIAEFSLTGMKHVDVTSHRRTYDNTVRLVNDKHKALNLIQLLKGASSRSLLTKNEFSKLLSFLWREPAYICGC